MSSSSQTTRFTIEKAIDVKTKRLSTGCLKLDEVLNGGLPTRGIIEISGESGSGKSQLCMQLSLTVQYPLQSGGLNGGAVFISTEEYFSSKRLQQLILNFPSKYYKDPKRSITFSDNIFVEHINCYDLLYQCLSKRVPILACKRNIRLVIIDSIAAIFRNAYPSFKNQKRAADMREIGNTLHWLCAKFDIMIVCVNQVTSDLSSIINQDVPALGLAWANLITHRIQLYKKPYSRKFQIVFSPELPPQSVDFVIQDCGIVE